MHSLYCIRKMRVKEGGGEGGKEGGRGRERGRGREGGVPPSSAGGRIRVSSVLDHTSLPTSPTLDDSPPGPVSRPQEHTARWVWLSRTPVSPSPPPSPSHPSPLHWNTQPLPPTSPASRTPITHHYVTSLSQILKEKRLHYTSPLQHSW